MGVLVFMILSAKSASLSSFMVSPVETSMSCTWLVGAVEKVGGGCSPRVGCLPIGAVSFCEEVERAFDPSNSSAVNNCWRAFLLRSRGAADEFFFECVVLVLGGWADQDVTYFLRNLRLQ